MDHEVGLFTIVQRLPAQPFHQLCSILCSQHIAQRIFLPQRGDAVRHGEQEQIVIAQDDLSRWAQLFEVAQDAEGARPAIDQVSRAPETVGGRIKPDLLQQLFQGVGTALDVADCVGCHRLAEWWSVS